MYECVTSHVQRSHVTHTKETPTRSRSRLIPSLLLRSLSRTRAFSRARAFSLSRYACMRMDVHKLTPLPCILASTKLLEE